ncbi:MULTISPECIES: hypothetical protein [Burkholderia cepacia complex]|uniref:Uncharacterized protein n=1 Tax=Burkholderia orbicola (strain AU 1054) TaxID=331271 RepID=A0A0H2XU91_BURO1|nr:MULTISPECIES: hypothetical protein [Burkholderia cepacia complex]ABK06976.1 conserved hypothetical protein [Burkholderia cenocepacia HI2424]MBJ9879143.1 hypothetical protein [Burkholderia cenocepacia]MCA8420664.1 hypothetical protein [Burkholderia cenocepacia]MDN7959813.1 hypothetical protein [Burkholderia orbicola]PNO75453.1 hypothetical protein DK10_000125 [Burkholderia cenocepacia]
MSALIFKQLFVQSTSQKLAGRFRFEPGLNLITGDDNSIGKSTLVRLPLWTLGCDFDFDTLWAPFDARTILEFEVDGRTYLAARHRNQIRLKVGEEPWTVYHSTSDAYEQAFASIVQFGAVLPRRKEKWIHEVPPPACYFSAFYVDQRRGWTEPWGSFVIHKYEDWRRPVINFHVGYHSAAYFEVGAEIAKGLQHIDADQGLIEKYGRAVEVLTLLAPPEELPTTDAELDSAIADIQNSMVAVKRREQRALSVLRAKHEELEITKVQRGIAQAAVDDIEKDYDFASTQLRDDVLVCPLCGTLHDNTLLERASLLQDRAQAEQQVASLTATQSKIEAAIETTLRRLDAVREELAKLNRRFKRLDKDVTVKSILETMGTDSVRRRAEEVTTTARLRLRANKKTLAEQRAAQSELIEDGKEESINAYYQSELAGLCDTLRLSPAFDVRTALPTGYRELAVSGGGADSSRMQLAYHLTMHRLIRHFKTEVLAPLILDTPNQQDQGALNYGLVSEELKRRATKDTQLFVCATRHAAMQTLEKDSTVIELDENRLLSTELYERLQAGFVRVFGE